MTGAVGWYDLVWVLTVLMLTSVTDRTWAASCRQALWGTKTAVVGILCCRVTRACYEPAVGRRLLPSISFKASLLEARSRHALTATGKLMTVGDAASRSNFSPMRLSSSLESRSYLSTFNSMAALLPPQSRNPASSSVAIRAKAQSGCSMSSGL